MRRELHFTFLPTLRGPFKVFSDIYATYADLWKNDCNITHWFWGQRCFRARLSERKAQHIGVRSWSRNLKLISPEQRLAYQTTSNRVGEDRKSPFSFFFFVSHTSNQRWMSKLDLKDAAPSLQVMSRYRYTTRSEKAQVLIGVPKGGYSRLARLLTSEVWPFRP